jgi:trimeric autotransporter adhesin
MRRIAAFVAIGTTLLSAGAGAAGAQTFTGSVRGEVKDANGVLPGATVTLINEATNVARETTTNDVGQYGFPAVTPGIYTVKVALTGYKSHERKGLDVATQRAIAIDITLELGTIQESITVTGESPLIETSSASTGGVLDNKALELLPAPGRAAYLMGVTVPTVVATGDTQFNRQQDQTNASLLSLGGGPRRGNNYLVDGLPITDMRNRAVVNPIIEAVDEVKVQVHTYDTEMGRTGGGILNVAMKSGTNNYRGTGFFQTRPTGLLEQNFFLELRGIDKPDQYYRLYGGGVGGPIIKDRTFFWGAAEGYRSVTTRNGEHRFPTTLERAGNFSQSRDASGNLIVIYDPLNRDANGNRIPFPGNIIPANRIDPVAAAILGYIPLPDSNVSNGQNNYARQTSIQDVADQFTGKVDHKFTDKVSLSGSYIYNKTDEPHSVFWDDNLFGSPSWLLKRRIHMLVVNNTWVQSDSTVYTFRGGWNRFDDSCSVPHAFDPGTLGFNPAFVNSIPAEGKKFPFINIGDWGGPDGFAGWCPRVDRQWYTWALNGTVTKLIGRHSWKAGAEFQRKGLNFFRPGQGSGRFDFNRDFTAGPNPFSPSTLSGSSMASLLLGYPTDASRGVIATPAEIFFNYFGAFIQDDFRLSNKLTMTYGLRLEHEQGTREKSDQIIVAFDESAVSPLDSRVNKTGTLLQGRTINGGLVYAGQDGFPNYQGDPPAIKAAPRVGVVYAINPNTVIRGGYGLFYAPWNYPAPGDTSYGNRGYTQVTSMQQSSPVPITRLNNPFPTGLQQPTGNTLGLLTGTGGEIDFVSQHKGAPYVQQWSADVQRELPGNMAVTIGYTGSRGTDLGFGGTNDTAVNINQLDPSHLSQGSALLDPVPNPFFGVAGAGGFASRATIERGQLLRPFPQFRDVLARQVTGARSLYHALIVQLDKRVSTGWGGRFAYTFSRLKDNQYGESNFYAGPNAGLPLNNYDPDAEYSLGFLDTPHRLTLAPIVELPFGQGRRYLNDSKAVDYLVGGWSFSAIVSFESGFPIQVRQSSNNTFGSTTISGNVAQRPNAGSGDPVNPGNITDRLQNNITDNQYLNPAAFTQAPGFTFGNLPRTDGDIRSPFRTNWDIVFNKSFRTGGTTRADLRLEILNAFNQPKYAGFDSVSFGTQTFGRVSTQAGFMRIWQISFRFAF